MPTYQRRTRVAAPLEAVWEFHSRIEGLEALTPAWMHLRVERLWHPDDGVDPETLPPGTRIELSMRPFDVGPRQRWTSRILSRERGDDHATFRDDMQGGPFQRWVHTHRFTRDGEGTAIEDRVEYRLPGGGLGEAASPLAVVGFEPMFRYRHRRTKALLEA